MNADTCHAELVWQREQAKRSELCDPVPRWAASEIGEIKSTPLSNSLPKREERNASPRPLRERVSVGRVRGQNNAFAKQTDNSLPSCLPVIRKCAAFTLAEVFHPAGKSRKIAFTLAEVLITLGIIGTVAAIVLPSLITNINDRVNAEKIRSAKYKFTKATDHMKSLGLIGPYSSTDAFVDELQKYFKIAKRCDADHIRACWPTDTVKLDNGKEWNIADTKTGKQLKMRTNYFGDYSSDNVAIITADGTPMILNYNKKCESLDPMKTYGWTTSDGKPESNATAGCVAAVFETNGNGRPNSFRKDVVAFNANGLGDSCSIKIDEKCFSDAFAPIPLTRVKCEELKDKLGIKSCYYDNDYWAGAVAECGGVQNMPTQAELEKIVPLLYEGNPNIGAVNKLNLTYNGKASEFGLPEPTFSLFSGDEETQQNARGWGFLPTSVHYHYLYLRADSTYYGLCTSD